MAFMTKNDLLSLIHREILDGLTRNDDNIITLAIDTAVSEMKGYLSARYDVNQIFNKTGTSRSQIVLMFAKDIAIYHIHCVHNPAKIPETRIERYNRAIDWLQDTAKEMINPDLPKPPGDDNDREYIQYGSNEKRDNHF